MHPYLITFQSKKILTSIVTLSVVEGSRLYFFHSSNNINVGTYARQYVKTEILPRAALEWNNFFYLKL